MRDLQRVRPPQFRDTQLVQPSRDRAGDQKSRESGKSDVTMMRQSVWMMNEGGTIVRGAIRKRGKRYEFAVRLDTTDVDSRQLKRAGFVLWKDAQAGLDHVRELVKLAGADDRLRRRIGDMVFATRYGRPLPSVDEVRRRIGVGREPDANMYTVAEFLDVWVAAIPIGLGRSTAESGRFVVA